MITNETMVSTKFNKETNNVFIVQQQQPRPAALQQQSPQAAAAAVQPPVASVTSAADDHWGYDPTACEFGPLDWGKLFPQAANGKHQSPIDILTAKAIYEPKFAGERPLKIAYDAVNSCKEIKNNGHTFVVSPASTCKSLVSGGPAADDCTYKLAQFHMHWGDSDNCGSEHLIDGRSYPAELHFVNWNTNEFKEAANAMIVNDHRGLLVLGVLLSLSVNDNPAIEKLIKQLKSIRLADQVAPIVLTENNNDEQQQQLDINDLLPEDTKSYYHYLGSLTTPPCTEAVKWIVFKMPITISARQLNEFRTQLHTCTKANECCDRTRMTFNYRPVCQLNNRKLYKSFMDKDDY
jgi:carbonic anhydrase